MKLDTKRLEESWAGLRGLRYWLEEVGQEPPFDVSPEVWARLVDAHKAGARSLADAVKAVAPKDDSEPEVTCELGKLFADVHDKLCSSLQQLAPDPNKFDFGKTTIGEDKEGRPSLSRHQTDGEKGQKKWGVSGTRALISGWLGVFVKEEGWLMDVQTKSASNAESGPKFDAVVVDDGLRLSCSPHQGLVDYPTIPPSTWTHDELNTTYDTKFANFAQAVADLFEKFESLPDNETDANGHGMNNDHDTKKLVRDIFRHLSERLCVVLQGPPGTGKTYAALELVRRMAEGDLQMPQVDATSGDKTESASKAAVEACQWSALRHTDPGVKPALPAVGKVVWELVQMHPGYAYEDFVRGLETDPSKEGVHFRPVDRIVLELAEVARQNPDTTVVLIMDEINRCNLSSVLGELILALEKDKRDRPIRLQYGGSASIPKNLWFIGTMNTADRSIAHIDYAIRRRFRFIDIPPTAAALESWYKSAESPKYRIAERVMRELNGQIAPPNLHVGPAYFMEDGDGELWTQRMADRLVYEVLPLLREYVAEDRKVLSTGLEIKVREQTFSLEANANDPTKALPAAMAVFALP